MSTTATPNCLICPSRDLEKYADYADMVRVTSDCRVWKRGGTLRQCRACGTVQVDCDETWLTDINEIYRTYSIYSQAGGEEQKVFDPVTGRAVPRSAWILEKLGEALEMPASGHLLDIGCGNGNFLKAFGARLPGWRLTGSEFDAKYKAQVEALPQVDLMHAGPLNRLPGRFDMVSLIHVLEHMNPRPLPYLQEVRHHMKPGGLLLVQLPYYCNNPFELLVADHSAHYTLPTAAQLLEAAGFEPLLLRDDLVPKELTLVMRLGAPKEPTFQPLFDPQVQGQLDWLKRCVAEMKALQARNEKVGIFGSSIAASWLAASLERPPDFFLDEDVSRRNRWLGGAPILTLDQAPAGAPVIVPMTSPFADKVAARLGKAANLHLVR